MIFRKKITSTEGRIVKDAKNADIKKKSNVNNLKQRLNAIKLILLLTCHSLDTQGLYGK